MMSYGSRKLGYDQAGCLWGDWPPSPAYTSSPSQTLRHRLVRTTDNAVSARLYACRRSSRLYISHFATSTVDNTVDLHAAKPDIRPESRFCLPHLHATPLLGGFPSEYRNPVWCGKTRMMGLPDGEKILKICLFVLTWSTNVTDRHTQRHRMTAMAAHMRSIARQKLR